MLSCALQPYTDLEIICEDVQGNVIPNANVTVQSGVVTPQVNFNPNMKVASLIVIDNYRRV